MIASFGIYGDPSLSPMINLRNHVLSMSISSLESRISNAACHNLCTTATPPPLLQSLLGLGLKFCPRPVYTTSTDELSDSLRRFDRDFFTKVFFAHEPDDPDWSPGQLFIRDENWEPNVENIDKEIIVRTQAFRKQLTRLFQHRKKTPSNLNPIQLRLLRTLRHHPKFLIVNSDKNLGPVVMERETYVHRCLTEHLLKPTYQHLSEEEANAFVTTTRVLLREFLQQFDAYILGRMDWKYLDRYLSSVSDPFAYFYALAKVHKSPWKTRPIVSVSGSILYGLGKWLDQQLQPIIKKLPTYLSSSFELKQDLDQLAGTDLRRMSLFTGDVIAMYPSIDLNDAFDRIQDFLYNSPLCAGISVAPIIAALRLVMTRNCFRFGDTYWLQTDGTAMGTPPAPSFATLYYGIFEIDLLQHYGDSLLYLRRYIDDQFGIWIHDPDPAIDCQRWEDFKQRQENYCSLSWEFSTLSKSANFLDLSLTVESYNISTSLYEKPLNLHLYIPPHSAHTPTVRTGLVTGGVYRILRLVSSRSNQQASLSRFYMQLLARGYKVKFLNFAFRQALSRFAAPPKTKVTAASYEHVFLHLPYHARDPPRKLIQQAFQEHMIRPRTFHKTFARACNHEFHQRKISWWNGIMNRMESRQIPFIVPLTQLEPPLETLGNQEGATIMINRLIVAYRQAPNLFPCHVEAKCASARPVSVIRGELVENFTE